MIKNKEIIISEKKYCKVCGMTCYDGIMIIDDFICEKCVDSITSIKYTDDNYEHVKDKIKYMLFKE